MDDSIIGPIMKILILNVDRDDDFGRKAKVVSPIVGIEQNIEAANKLGQSDPEDSDLNAIFSAISIYKTLKKEGNDVEIATICGHINVGLKSDQILSNQLERVIKRTTATEVILISDGAEDEHILPIIQSRIKITSIHRVSVKQSQQLEDTYYRLVKLLDDEKVQKQFLLPIALVLIVWAFFVLLDMTKAGFGAILLTLGGYLLIRVFRWERSIAIMIDEIKSGFLTGKLSLYTSILAVVIIVINIFIANQNYSDTKILINNSQMLQILFLLKEMIWGIVIAGLLIIVGRVVDTYVRERKSPWRYWIFPFSLFAFGFISWSISNSLYEALINWPAHFDVEPFKNANFILYIILGVMIAFAGAITNHFIREIHMDEEKEIEIEKETNRLLD